MYDFYGLFNIVVYWNVLLNKIIWNFGVVGWYILINLFLWYNIPTKLLLKGLGISTIPS
jgi:hypothetical protein